MAGLMDGLNKAMDKLQDLGGKAVDGAKDAFDPSKPGVREQMKVILKGLGLPPTKATITVNLLSFRGAIAT